MKFLRHGPSGHERPGVLDAAGRPRDLASVVPDIDANLLASNFSALKGVDVESLPLVDTGARLGPPVAGVGKFICIGLNYRDHALESGMPIPEEPIIFMKATSAIIGPDDDVILPPTSAKSDWEVELGVVIGTEARYVPPERALDHVAGLCVVNDLSEREYQLERGGQWDKGKGCDSFGPVGPYLVSKDEIPDPQNLALWTEVDDLRRQNGTTSNMIFGVTQLVSYISQFITLHPGDIIATGTPAGVGMGIKPSPIYLRPGQEIRVGVQGLGEQFCRTVGG